MVELAPLLFDNGALAPRACVVRASRGARRSSTRVLTLRAEDRGILNNRRIEYPRQAEDRYVSSIEYRVSLSSTRDPCNRIDSRKATGQAAQKQQSLHEGAINCGQSKRQSTEEQEARTNKGKRPENNKASMREQQVSGQQEQEAQTNKGKRPE